MKLCSLILLTVTLLLPTFGELDELPRNIEQLNQQGLKIDLDQIKERGFIRVLTRNNPTCYFMHRGLLMGFEYELIQNFAQQLDLDVVVIVPENRDELAKWLEEGRADVIAANVTMMPDHFKNKRELEFGHRYGEFHETIVARADDHSIQSLEDLKGRKIYVRKSSSYYKSLTDLRKSKKLKFKIKLVPESEEIYEILDKVARGEYDLTCADQTILNESVRLKKQLKSVVQLPMVQSYGWVVRKNQPELLKAINVFFEKELNSSTYSTIYNRYFNLTQNATLEETFSMNRDGVISPYDDLVKKYAAEYGFDWTLICAQMFQESAFKNDTVSWSGAQGLMQLMPATAKAIGVEDPLDPAQNIRGGTYYLKQQYKRVPDGVDVLNTTCFALAAYNGGYGHLIDARSLAEKTGKNPNVWTENVAEAYALLSEPHYAKSATYGHCNGGAIIDYVQKIMSRYVAYETSEDNAAF
jgi:membrane-bound lytic murein transglycosylase F